MIYVRFKIDNPEELYNPKHSNQIFSLTSVSESEILTLVLKLKLKLTLIHEYNFCKFMDERIYYRTIPTSNNFIIILFYLSITVIPIRTLSLHINHRFIMCVTLQNWLTAVRVALISQKLKL